MLDGAEHFLFSRICESHPLGHRLALRHLAVNARYEAPPRQHRLVLLRAIGNVHRKKLRSKPMRDATRLANDAKSKIRSRVEHFFAAQKDRMDLFILTIGIARATTKIGMANRVYNVKRLHFLHRIATA
jgi:hypothetical protein